MGCWADARKGISPTTRILGAINKIAPNGFVIPVMESSRPTRSEPNLGQRALRPASWRSAACGELDAFSPDPPAARRLERLVGRLLTLHTEGPAAER
jgi:hypothetical protein